MLSRREPPEHALEPVDVGELDRAERHETVQLGGGEGTAPAFGGDGFPVKCVHVALLIRGFGSVRRGTRERFAPAGDQA